MKREKLKLPFLNQIKTQPLNMVKPELLEFELLQKMALHGLSKKLPEKKHPRNRLDAYFSG